MQYSFKKISRDSRLNNTVIRPRLIAILIEWTGSTRTDRRDGKSLDKDTLFNIVHFISPLPQNLTAHPTLLQVQLLKLRQEPLYQLKI